MQLSYEDIQAASSLDNDTAANAHRSPSFNLLSSEGYGVTTRTPTETIWFDHKWLRFSGIGIVPFQFPAFMKRDDGALDGFYQNKVTFPPFTPNRVLAQWSFVRIDDDYAEAPLRVLPHPSEKQPSEMNLHRRIEDFSRSASFVWYSTNTLENGRASVMVYSVVGDRVETWFAAFKRQQGWSLDATKGASRDEVQELLNTT